MPTFQDRFLVLIDAATTLCGCEAMATYTSSGQGEVIARRKGTEKAVATLRFNFRDDLCTS
jgi:hypothetical protein